MPRRLPCRRLIAVLIALLASLGWAQPGATQSPPATPLAPTVVVTPAPAGTPPVSPPPPVQVIRPIPFVPSADYLGAVGGNAATLALRGVARAPMHGFAQLVTRVFTPGGDDEVNVVFMTPPGLTYQAPAVQAVHGTLLTLVLGSVSSLLVLIGAANLALRRRWDLPVDEPGMLLLRLLAASVVAVLSLELLGLAIELNNALIRTLLAVPLCEPGATCRPHVFATLGASFGRLTAISLLDLDLIEVLATLALGIVLLILAIQQLVRIGFLAVLLAVAPLAFMLWVLPQTRWLVRMWTSAFFATLLAQPLQVLTYLLAAGLLALATPPGHTTPGVNLVSVLIGLATLGVSLSIPRLLRSGVSVLESPPRTATRTLVLWTMADRLATSAARRDRQPGRESQAAPAAGQTARPTAAAGWSAGVAPRGSASSHPPTMASSVAAARHGAGDTTWLAPDHVRATGGASTDQDPTTAAMAALLADPGATIYVADRAGGGLPVPVSPTDRVPIAADTTATVTFADQRPDRVLTAAEVTVVARLAGVTAGGPTGSQASTLPSASNAGRAGDDRPPPPAPSPITLPPPRHDPTPSISRRATPPGGSAETTA